MPVHPAARGFSAAADAYARGRPDYPPDAIDRVAEWLALGQGRTVADLGAGTGKLARLLAARGARVLAVEPSAEMLSRARAAGVHPVRALAEALPVRDGGLDGAAAATAFHWFDGPAVVVALHRALRPGARLALLWNLRDESVPWVAALSTIVNRGEAGVPRYRHGAWRRALEGGPGRFRRVDEAVFRHVHTLSPEALVDRIASVSFVASAAPEDRARVLEEVRALVSGHPDTAGRATVSLAYRVEAFCYERLPG